MRIHHITGNESNIRQQNLMGACHACNVKVGAVMRAHGLGKITDLDQKKNPAGEGAKTLGAWMSAVKSLRGESQDMAPKDAVALIHATPPARRSRFAEDIWRIRRSRGTDTSTAFRFGNPLFTRSEKKRVRKKVTHKIRGAARAGFASLFGIPLSPGLGGSTRARGRRRGRVPSSSSASGGVRGDVLSALKNLGYKKDQAEGMIPAAGAGEGFDSLFRRSVKRNPGELIIFGNPARVYGREQLLPVVRSGNPFVIPPSILEGLGFQAGSRLYSAATARPRRRPARGSARRRRNDLPDFRAIRHQERVDVQRALRAAGYRAKVKHGRGTAHSWLDIKIDGRPFTEHDYNEVKAIAARASGRSASSAENIGVDFDLRRNPLESRAMTPSTSSDLCKCGHDKQSHSWVNWKYAGLKRHPRGHQTVPWCSVCRRRCKFRTAGPRRNPSADLDQAADLYKGFQGRDPSGVYDMHVSAKRRKDFAILGPLVAIGNDGEKYDRLRPREPDVVEHWEEFPHIAFLSPADVDKVKRILDQPARFLQGGAILASSPGGKQLYCISEDPLDLPAGIAGSSKDFVDLGEATFIVYVAKKHRSAPAEYVHIFGEDGGTRPRIGYARIAKEVFFIGGSYRVEAPGIIN